MAPKQPAAFLRKIKNKVQVFYCAFCELSFAVVLNFRDTLLFVVVVVVDDDNVGTVTVEFKILTYLLYCLQNILTLEKK